MFWVEEFAELKKQTQLVKLEMFFSLFKCGDSIVAPHILISRKKLYDQW